MMMVKNSNWDLDYSLGKEGEDMVDAAVKGIVSGTIEVKRDMKWIDTGNLYIETECFYRASNSWEPSGLSVTKASHWAFVLANLILIIPIDELKTVVEVEGHPIETDIEPNPSKGFLVKVEYFLRKARYAPTRD